MVEIDEPQTNNQTSKYISVSIEYQYLTGFLLLGNLKVPCGVFLSPSKVMFTVSAFHPHLMCVFLRINEFNAFSSSSVLQGALFTSIVC